MVANLVHKILRDYAPILQVRNVRLLVASSCVLAFMRGPLPWLLPILLLQMGGPLFLGAALAVANVDDTVMSFVGGVLADRYGRKPVLVFSRLMYACGTGLLASSMLVGGAFSRGALFAAVVFLYGMTGVSPGPGSAILAESVEPHYVGRTFSLASSFSLLFRSLGSAALGLIYHQSGIAASFVLISLAFVSMVLMLLVEETLRSRTGQTSGLVGHFVGTFRRIGRLGALSLIPLLLLVVGNGLGHGVVGNFFSPFLKEIHGVSPAVLGGAFAAIPLLQAMLMLPAGWLVDRRGPFLALVIGNVAVGGWVLLLGAVRSVSLAIAAVVVSGCLGAFHGVGYNTAVAKLSEDRMRAALFGSLDTLWNAMFIVGPLVGGTLYGLHPSLTFLVAGSVLLLTLLPIMKLRFVARSQG